MTKKTKRHRRLRVPPVTAVQAVSRRNTALKYFTAHEPTPSFHRLD